MIHFLHQLLILEHGWNSSKIEPYSLPGFSMAECKAIAAGVGVGGAWGTVGAAERTSGMVLVEPTLSYAQWAQQCLQTPHCLEPEAPKKADLCVQNQSFVLLCGAGAKPAAMRGNALLCSSF